MSNASGGPVPVALHPDEGVALMLMGVVLSVVTIVSNGLLVYVVVRSAALHTSTNFFIASLALGELLTGLFVIPFAGTSSAGQWGFTPAMCCFVGFNGVLGPCVSAFSLLVVSADRYVAISTPLRYAILVNKTSTTVVIAAVWVLSTLMSALPLVARWGSYLYSDGFRTCLMRSSPGGGWGGVPEVLQKEVLCNLIPVTLVILIVLKTVNHIRGHRRVFAFVPVLVPVAATASLAPGTRTVNARNSRVKATRTLLLVSAAFVTLCVPSAVANVVCHRAASCHVISARALRALLWLSFLSCVINPVIIMTLNGKFRARLKLLACRGRGRRGGGGWCCCGTLKVSPGDQDPFTITSGLQAVLEASLLVNVMHGAGERQVKQRRHVIMTSQARAAELTALYASGARLGVVTLRRTRSSPDCRLAAAQQDEGQGPS